ncbi:MAG: ribonuclease PH [Gemmatimonadales bacterium]|nr:ribonuclease PH [Gemmatimonadales bacterium]MDG2238728.1 ribonuclease PH [Longimicrobiales bacterium]MBT3498836.1 ribonuclease PH [Gemmatimonadales bacterium]MBT3775195.1 ribonuclease PH [Gemmatimonadales bacterium]MBT3956834.1 ribonuclease PH [Gemmatimonadales bacterium]
MTTRSEGRRPDDPRSISIETGVAPYAEGSCIIATGQTRVLCTASVVEGVPSWRERSGDGWVTAEYAMLPRATHTRSRRERNGPKGRTQEIQRLIGRSLRSVTDMKGMGQNTVTVDCDVLQADGGTRTASITGACVALALAGEWMLNEGIAVRSPLRERVAAVSVGIVDGVPCLDLDYPEDSSAQVDMNVVGTEGGGLVEVQGTAEGDPFSRAELDALIDLATSGLERLFAAQSRALKGD